MLNLRFNPLIYTGKAAYVTISYYFVFLFPLFLTHWGRVTHICFGELTIIGSDNGLSPGWRQAIIWTNAGALSIGPLGNFYRNSYFFIQENKFDFVVCEMAAILSWHQCVNPSSTGLVYINGTLMRPSACLQGVTGHQHEVLTSKLSISISIFPSLSMPFSMSLTQLLL